MIFMKSIQQRIKVGTVVISLFYFVMFSASMLSMINAIEYKLKPASDYEVKLVQDGNTKVEYYALYIGGEEYQQVDFNEYGQDGMPGSNSAKQVLFTEHCVKAIQCLLVAIVLFFISMALKDVQNGGKPFSKFFIRCLRLSALFTILLGILPGTVKFILSMFYLSNYFIKISANAFFVILIGIVIGVISEIFIYGKEHQEEMDQIA